MSEIRASHIGSEYDPDRSDPRLAVRDEYGILRPVTRIYRLRPSAGEFPGGPLKGYGDVLVLEVEHA